MICKNCGVELEEGVSFCKKCGNKVERELEKHFCRECGTKLQSKVKFCSKCGADVRTLDNASVGQAIADKNNNQEGLIAEDDVNTQKNYEFSHQDNKAERLPFNKDKDSENKEKKYFFDKWTRMDVFSKLCAVAIAISILLLAMALFSFRLIPILLSIFQIGGVIVALLIHNNKVKASNKCIEYIILIIVVFFILLNFMSFSIGNDNLHENNNRNESPIEAKNIEIPVGYSDCVGQNYINIESDFAEAGFKNVTFIKIEDLAIDEAEKVGMVEMVSVDGRNDFEKSQIVKCDKEVVVSYHCYKKCIANIHINFIPNLIFSKYDVEFYFGGNKQLPLSHGEDADYEFLIEPGKYTLEFVSADSALVKGETEIEITGDANISYEISCYRDEVSIDVEYIHNLSEFSDSDIMMTVDAAEYKYNDYKEVMKALQELGFSEITTAILYDIELGWTIEGETDSVSIAGNSSFSKWDVFSKDDPVIVTYHMKAEDDPSKKEQISESKQDTTDNSQDIQDDRPIFYSSNTYDNAIEGNCGVFAYKKAGGSYDMYYIIDFDEGYVYCFTEGNDEDGCERLKIESGTLNDALIITYHDGSDVWSNNLHFNYTHSPETLIMVDQDGFDYKFSPTSLSSALSLKNKKTVKDY